HIERRFIEVPIGSTWVEATMRASGFDTPRHFFFINCLQICPKIRSLQWESVVTFLSPSLKSFSHRVESGRTVEITIAQFWSSGNGSLATMLVDLEVEFHGISANKEEILRSGSDAPTKIDVKALSTETLAPVAILTKVRVPYRPVEAGEIGKIFLHLSTAIIFTIIVKSNRSFLALICQLDVMMGDFPLCLFLLVLAFIDDSMWVERRRVPSPLNVMFLLLE
ncbi:hypothetical protein KI387_005125, partial [Taxus chinensis]